MSQPDRKMIKSKIQDEIDFEKKMCWTNISSDIVEELRKFMKELKIPDSVKTELGMYPTPELLPMNFRISYQEFVEFLELYLHENTEAICYHSYIPSFKFATRHFHEEYMKKIMEFFEKFSRENYNVFICKFLVYYKDRISFNRENPDHPRLNLNIFKVFIMRVKEFEEKMEKLNSETPLKDHSIIYMKNISDSWVYIKPSIHETPLIEEPLLEEPLLKRFKTEDLTEEKIVEHYNRFWTINWIFPDRFNH